MLGYGRILKVVVYRQLGLAHLAYISNVHSNGLYWSHRFRELYSLSHGGGGELIRDHLVC